MFVETTTTRRTEQVSQVPRYTFLGKFVKKSFGLFYPYISYESRFPFPNYSEDEKDLGTCSSVLNDLLLLWYLVFLNNFYLQI